MVKVREDMTGWIMAEHGVPDSRLTVICQIDDYVSPSGQHLARWLCECNCEQHKQIKVDGRRLKHGYTLSCGCIQKEKAAKILKDKHITNIYDLSGEYGIGWTNNTNKEFYFDLEDYDKIKDICWSETFSKNKNYSLLTGRDVKTGKTVKMHILLGYKDYDHKDRNALNNRKSNFRKATKQENSRNRSMPRNNTSGFIGVSWSTEKNKWRATIDTGTNYMHLGYFKNKENAIKARLEAEMKYFGEFAPQRHLFEEYGINDKGEICHEQKSDMCAM